MNSVIIFDIVPESAMVYVIRSMAMRGYHKSWGSNAETIHLPHNVLWKSNTSQQQALDDLNLSVSIVNVLHPCTLQRCIVLNSTPWKSIVCSTAYNSETTKASVE